MTAVDITRKNYMTWAVAAKMHLKGKKLLNAIDVSETTSNEKKASDEDKVNAMIFLFHHIHDGLKDQYITKEDSADLWKSLKDMFDHQKYVSLPKAKYEWLNLRIQDYKSVGEYNSALFGITSRMMLYGVKVSDHDMIEKTLQTFHPGNVILQQQYRARGYTLYSELIQTLLVAEQNNELVMLNYQTRPTGSAPFPEANVVASSYNNWQRHGSGRGRGRGRGQGRGFHFNNFNTGRIDKKSQENKVGKTVNKHYETVNCKQAL